MKTNSEDVEENRLTQFLAGELEERLESKGEGVLLLDMNQSCKRFKLLGLCCQQGLTLTPSNRQMRVYFSRGV